MALTRSGKIKGRPRREEAEPEKRADRQGSPPPVGRLLRSKSKSILKLYEHATASGRYCRRQLLVGNVATLAAISLNTSWFSALDMNVASYCHMFKATPYGARAMAYSRT